MRSFSGYSRLHLQISNRPPTSSIFSGPDFFIRMSSLSAAQLFPLPSCRRSQCHFRSCTAGRRVTAIDADARFLAAASLLVALLVLLAMSMTTAEFLGALLFVQLAPPRSAASHRDLRSAGAACGSFAARRSMPTVPSPQSLAHHATLRHPRPPRSAGVRRRPRRGHRARPRRPASRTSSRSASRPIRAPRASKLAAEYRRRPRGRRHAAELSGRGASRAIGIASSRCSTSRASWRSAKRASTATGTSRRSTCSRIISTGTCGCRRSAACRSSSTCAIATRTSSSCFAKRTPRGPLNGVMHSFTGSRAMADECLAMGLYISFAGMVTYKKSAELRDDRRRRAGRPHSHRDRQPVSVARAGPQDQAERAGPRALHGRLPGRSPRHNARGVRRANDSERQAIVSIV